MHHRVRIYEADEVPDLSGFEKMEGYATDAYPYQHETGASGSGDFSVDARELAIRTVAHEYNIPQEEVPRQFEVCIVPAFGFHGHIMARRQN